MLAPLSWLKDYIDITLKTDDLKERLSEVGVGVESEKKEGSETIFELEITPNRPDWLSMIGIAREIAAIEGKQIKYPQLKTNLKPTGAILPLEIKVDTSVSPRFTGIIIEGITVKDSPDWLKKRLELIGQRPINNIVDITNYIMFELGNPIHAFDYDKIEGNIMIVHQSKGGEQFKSVDGISYHLPKDAVVISDKNKIIDLCGIKGGYNSGTFKETKTIFIHIPVEIPILIRRASQSLGLRSEASSIFERGVNKGGTIDTLKRTVDLVLELAGGRVASEIYDIKKEEFKPWKLSMRIERLHKMLGIEIPEKKILEILESLNLGPVITKGVVQTTIPTYRNDLQIEEDLIEEVARLYGYSNFPLTLPQGEIKTDPIPYYKDYKFDEKVKNFMTAAGFSEIYTYSLVSEKDVEDDGYKPDHILRVDNPVSREFEYTRPTLQSSLVKALKQNTANFKDINIFEVGRVYRGKTLDVAEEENMLSGISNSKNYSEIKGLLERLLSDVGVTDLTQNIQVLDEGIFFEMSFDELYKKANSKKMFKPLPKYPPVIEDLALIVKASVKTGEIIDEIKKQSEIIESVSLLDEFDKTRTFHLVFQHPDKNLTTKDVTPIREKIISSLQNKFAAKLKE